MNNIVEKAQQAANAVNVNGWDYCPYDLEGYPKSYSIYNYSDGIWLVDTKDEASMQKAEKMVMLIKHK